MVVCLTSARFNMKADVLRQVYTDTTHTNEPVDAPGEWVNQQDPDSGEMIRVWEAGVVDNPSTPEIETSQESFDCIARGIIDGGIRVSGTTERWSEIYENVDYVRITFPASVLLSRRDKVTNIRNRAGVILWREEEQPDSPPTVFEVTGITPIPDPFGNHIENMALLQRAERQ